MVLRYVIASVVAYACGNFATSYLVSKRAANIDIRKYGSGNAGATNVLRVLGLKHGLITFIGDALKAVIAVLAGRYIAGENGALLAGFFAVIGHNWPVVLKLKGGKGVAATIGAMLAIKPLVVLIVVPLGILVMVITKYVSLASIMGMVMLPIVIIIMGLPWKYIVFSLVLCVIALYKHRSNIVRLIKGTESKFGQKVKPE